MAKTRNFKQGITSERGSVIKLKSVLEETRKLTNGGINNLKKRLVIDEVALNGILNSGVIGKTESSALKEFLQSKKIRKIDEVNVGRIDESVKLLREDWWDTTKNWVKGKKDQFVDAVTAGWAGVKKIWNNFKDMILELVKFLKETFKKIMEDITKSVQSGLGKFKSKFTEDWYTEFHKDHPHEHVDLVTELKQLFESGKFMLQYAKTKIVDGGKWEKDLIAGNGNPKGDVEGDENEKAVAADAEKIAQESYRHIFVNKNILSELASKNLIIEGHLEDTLKNHPTLKAIVKWGMLLVKAIFSPLTLALTKAGEMLAKNLFKGISTGCKLLGGPGIFDFAIMTLMSIEVYEIMHSLHGIHDVDDMDNPKASDIAKFIASAGAQFIPGVDVLVLLVKILAFCIMGYSIGTILYNLFMAYKALKGGGEEGSEEPKVQTAGYKPKGEFKIKEGKLLFIS